MSKIADIVLADDPDAAAAFLETCPEDLDALRRAATKTGARRVLHEIEVLTSPSENGSLDTPRIEIRLQGHSVILGRDHAYLMVIVDDHPAFAGDPRFENQLPDGRRYATLGAGPANMNPFFSTLISGINRKADLSALLIDTFDVEIQHPDVDGGLRTERAVVDELFAADSRYCDQFAYDIVPFSWSDGFNSNSYVAGLLSATGWQVERPGRVPGWTKPLPPDAFRDDDETAGDGQCISRKGQS